MGFVLHALENERLEETERLGWAIALVAANVLTVPLYFLVHLRRR